MEEYPKEQKTENKKKISGFTIIGIVGVCLVIAGIIFFIITFTKPLDPQDHSRFVTLGLGGGLLIIGSFLSFPIFAKIGIKMNKQIINNNEGDLAEIADKSADIMGPALTKGARSVKKGLSDETQSKEQKASSSGANAYCTNCGAQLQEGAKFCGKCGTKQ